MKILAGLGIWATAAVAWAATPVETPNTVITSTGVTEVLSTDTTTTFTIRENVVVVGNNIRLTCDRLVVVARRTGDLAATIGKQDVFESLVATGHVSILQGDREAACERAEVLPGEDKVVLSGDPVIRSTDQLYVARYPGRRVVLYRGQRLAVAEGGENAIGTMTLPPIKDLGYEPGKVPNPKPERAAAPSK